MFSFKKRKSAKNFVCVKAGKLQRGSIKLQFGVLEKTYVEYSLRRK